MKRSQQRLFSFVFLIGGVAVNAQEINKQAKIERLISVMNAETIQNQIFDQVKSVVASQIRPGTTPEQAAQQQEVFAKLMDFVKSRMNSAKIHSQMVQIYDETYTEEEVTGILPSTNPPLDARCWRKCPQWSGN